MNVHVASAFSWPLPSRYEWINAREVNDDGVPGRRVETVLVPRDAQTAEDFGSLSNYEPLVRDTGLFLQLAAIKPEPEAILEFATKFGPLALNRIWIPEGVDVPLAKTPPKLRPSATRVDNQIGHLAAEVAWEHFMKHGAVVGDSLDRWKQLIDRVGDLAYAWNALRSNDADQLAKAFPIRKRHGKDQLQLRGRDDTLVMADVLIGTPSKSKLRVNAERLLLDAINEHLQGKFNFGLTVGDGTRRSWFSIHPKSLEAAVWLQFAQAVLGNKEFRECEACGTPFEVSLDAFRTNRTLCSSACKARAHRMRRAETLALAAEGKTAKQIAKKVGSKLETIQKWLEEREDE
jgi:hypothetical protein